MALEKFRKEPFKNMYIGFGLDILTILVISVVVVLIYGGLIIFKYIFSDFYFNFRGLILDSLVIISLVVILLLTLSPIHGFQLQPVHISMNLVPFNNIMEMFAFSTSETVLRMVGGNILLFIPLTFFMTLRFMGILSPLKIIFVAIMLSVFIEFLQLFHPLRQTNVDDVILNTFGAILGVLAALIVGRIIGIRGGYRS